ncbi:MAG TPA: hypothetical protein ENL33_00755, partial [Candidatus Parcubacteria bacterium]|nr:hypothetical protein [Candidatus Parcubacteria bacterium]
MAKEALIFAVSAKRLINGRLLFAENMKNKKYFYLLAFVLTIISVALFFVFGGRKIEISNLNPSTSQPVNQLTDEISPISGLPCKNYNRRP